MMVNKVKRIKQMRSTTMAANFQSLLTRLSSSSCRILSVITRSSFKIPDNSRWDPKQLCNEMLSSGPMAIWILISTIMSSFVGLLFFLRRDKKTKKKKKKEATEQEDLFFRCVYIPWFGARPPLGVETTRGNPAGTPILRAIPLPTELRVQLCCRKSSSMSSTLASKLRDERSLISISLICLLLEADVADDDVTPPAADLPRGDSSLSHGRLILNIQGSQMRNTVRTWNNCVSFNKHTSSSITVSGCACHYVIIFISDDISYPWCHLVGVRVTMVVIENQHGGDDRRRHHEHDAVKVRSYARKKMC